MFSVSPPSFRKFRLRADKPFSRGAHIFSAVESETARGAISSTATVRNTCLYNTPVRPYVVHRGTSKLFVRNKKRKTYRHCLDYRSAYLGASRSVSEHIGRVFRVRKYHKYR